MTNPRPQLTLLALVLFLWVGCTHGSATTDGQEPTSRPAARPAVSQKPIPPGGEGVATFAGGCFWCMEKPFEKLDGVSAVISGYTGGAVKNPTYEAVCSGRTGHTEAVLIRFDPKKIRYEDLLEVLWRQCDPTDLKGQFVDRGTQYRPEIFVHSDAQKKAAEKSRAALEASGRFGKPVVIPITPAVLFYPAEEYHQDYYIKSTAHYERYRRGSGRDFLLDRVWGKDRKYTPKPVSKEAGGEKGAKYQRPSAEEIKKRLTALQYKVTQKDGTEPAFRNEFWDNKKEGLYVDVVTGEPLFSSRDKFKSGTGWPSFVRPIADGVLKTATDYKVGHARTEVRSKIGDSHLGHVFKDGPRPTGLRYCINSAALRFVPRDGMKKAGYGDLISKVGPVRD